MAIGSGSHCIQYVKSGVNVQSLRNACKAMHFLSQLSILEEMS